MNECPGPILVAIGSLRVAEHKSNLKICAQHMWICTYLLCVLRRIYVLLIAFDWHSFFLFRLKTSIRPTVKSLI